MIPILYGSNEVNFTSNGLGRLRSCIEAKVVEERNGIYEMDFSYPVDGENYDLIQLGRIIGVTHEDSDDIQPFDIVSCSRPIGGVVTFHCTHISYRQSKMVTYGTSVSTLTGAFRIFEQVFYPEKPLGYTSSGNPFVYETDKSGTAYIPAFDGTPRTIRSILGGVEGSILDTFGGEYEWDKWNVILHTARGEAKNFSIRYGVNLIDFQDDTDYGESFNTCVPFWKDLNTGTVVMGGEVSSGQGAIGVGDKCVPLDLTDKFEEQPTVAELENMATDVMSAKQPYLPSQNIKVDFIRLQDEAGFDEFDSLLQCKLCDSIKVIFPRYDMSAYFKIVKTTWDVLLDRYESMELGNLSTTLAEALGISDSFGSTSSGGSGDSVDYVVEQGTSGIWTYRKWNSGIAECWGSYSFSVSGNRPQVTPPDYPSGLFTAKPTVNTSQEYSSGSYGFWLSTGGGSAGTELRPPKYTIYTDVSASTTTSGTLYFNAHGKWK